MVESGGPPSPATAALVGRERPIGPPPPLGGGSWGAKQRELATHDRAILCHDQAAELQERLAHPDRAATARTHAQHARELRQQALQELRDRQVRTPASAAPPAPTPS